MEVLSKWSLTSQGDRCTYWLMVMQGRCKGTARDVAYTLQVKFNKYVHACTCLYMLAIYYTIHCMYNRRLYVCSYWHMS
jgi:hypothetical protein